MVSGRYTDSGTRKYCEVLKSTRAVLRISQFFLVPLTIYRPDIIVRNINYPFCWSRFEAKRRDNMKGICSQCDAYIRLVLPKCICYSDLWNTRGHQRLRQVWLSLYIRRICGWEPGGFRRPITRLGSWLLCGPNGILRYGAEMHDI